MVSCFPSPWLVRYTVFDPENNWRRYFPGTIVAGIALDSELRDRNVVDFWINQAFLRAFLYYELYGCTPPFFHPLINGPLWTVLILALYAEGHRIVFFSCQCHHFESELVNYRGDFDNLRLQAHYYMLHLITLLLMYWGVLLYIGITSGRRSTAWFKSIVRPNLLVVVDQI